MTRYWLKIIHDNDDFYYNSTNPTGMSWGSIKMVRTISNDPKKQYSSINAYQQVSVNDPVIIKITNSNEVKYGTFTQIKWGNTQGLDWKNLNGNNWENLFWIENAKTGTFDWRTQKLNLQFLSQFTNMGHAFSCGMWELLESDYQYILSNIK